MVSRYHVGHKAYGWWYCYADCAVSPSTYVMLAEDTAVFFISDTYWLGQRVAYSTGMRVTWYDDPQKAANYPPDFIGPTLGVHTYHQGLPDSHDMEESEYCDSWVYDGTTVTVSCKHGFGTHGYYQHAPRFYNETNVYASDGLAYFATGHGDFDWGWDGINENH